MKTYNFSAGPAPLPDEVLEQLRHDMLNYRDTGLSVMELAPDSRETLEILMGAEDALRRLLSIPQNYRIIFYEGNVYTQYSAIPLNLLSEHKCADYVISGRYSKLAELEAKRYGDIAIAASSGGATPPFSALPMLSTSNFRPDADYVHICFNDAVYGTKFYDIPDTGNIPLVADMSSCLLSEPIDVSHFGLIYASTEANICPPSMTLIIVRDDLMGKMRENLPSKLSYRNLVYDDTHPSMPPLFSIYTAKLMFEWMLANGGLVEMKRRNERKASLLYDFLDDQTKYYTTPVSKDCRSMMNVVFTTGDGELDRKFVQDAAARGLVNLSGDPVVGGLRASLYNAMPGEGVQELVKFMREFQTENIKFKF
jgi:phosphoserine aminotransferase